MIYSRSQSSSSFKIILKSKNNLHLRFKLWEICQIILYALLINRNTKSHIILIFINHTISFQSRQFNLIKINRTFLHQSRSNGFLQNINCYIQTTSQSIININFKTKLSHTCQFIQILALNKFAAILKRRRNLN